METEDRRGDEVTWRWHDNTIHGLSFGLAEPDTGDWRSDLVLDIDHIVEWLCGGPGEFRFRVAPTSLTFHDVTDLAIQVDQGNSGGRNALFEWSIDRVERQPLDRPVDYWRWIIHLHSPTNCSAQGGGSIAFCASGFTQEQTAEPILLEEQRLPRSVRRRQ